MDDMTAFERQLGTVLDRMGGPEPGFDAMAIASQAATATPVGRWSVITRGLGLGRVPASTEGGFSMLSAVKLVAAAAVVALFGGFLLLALPSGQETSPLPAASSPTPAVTESTDGGPTPRPTPEEWSGLEATDPRLEGQPTHPLMNVGFQRFEDDWRVLDLAREGMDLSPLNMAIGPDWDVWQHDQGACGDKMLGEEVPCIWQVGVPGVTFLPDGVELLDLAVAPDGVIWGVSQEGFVTFDGHEWVEYDHGARREDDAGVAWRVAPDGSAWLLDERPGGRFQLIHATTEGLEQIDVAEPSGASGPIDLAYSLAVSSDGSVWVGGEPAACFPCPELETPVAFIARFDGKDWIHEDPLGDGATMTGADVTGGPDGFVWARIDRDDGNHLARLEGSRWTTFDIDEPLRAGRGYSHLFMTGSDGTIWIAASIDGEGPSLVSFDGQTLVTHLAGKDIRDAAAAPDGSVWVSIEDDGVYAVRH